MSETIIAPAQNQLGKFRKAARHLEANHNPKRFAEHVGKLAKHRRVEMV